MTMRPMDAGDFFFWYTSDAAEHLFTIGASLLSEYIVWGITTGIAAALEDPETARRMLTGLCAMDGDEIHEHISLQTQHGNAVHLLNEFKRKVAA